MRRIYKISITLVILVGIYLLLPFLFGMAAQRYSTHFLKNENQTLGKVLGINLEFSQYNRGWFSSKAVLQIEKKAADGNVEIVKSIPIVIHHGPTYRYDGRIFSGLGMITSNDVPLDKNSPYEISFRENIGYRGEQGAFFLFSNKKNMPAGNFQVGTLALRVNSDLKADQFLFRVSGNNLRFQDPEKSIAASVQDLQSTLRAQYFGDRNWKLTVGFGLGKNKLSAIFPGNTSSAITVNADRIDLIGLHFDTLKMADILKEVIELRQATNAQQPIKPTAWMALFQQLLTQMIQSDTWADIKGLSITTPMGELEAHYDVSFPTLSMAHDYFDVVTRNVSTLQIAVPHWIYTDAANTEFGLSNFQYDEYNNTVFSRKSNMSFGAIDVRSMQPVTAMQAQSVATLPSKTPLFYATGFSYQGELYGDIRSLSQTMQWQLAKLCFSNGCFNQAHGELQLLGMNYDAFRGIADATRKVVQYNPQQSESLAVRWIGLANAYSKLISPDTQLILTHDMNTPEGKMALHGELSWPTVDLNTTTAAAPTWATFINQAVYEFHLLFPAEYVDSFLAQEHAATPVNPAEKTKAESPELQVAQFLQYALSQGYLKKVGKEYVIDLTGKGNIVTINGVAWKMPG